MKEITIVVLAAFTGKGVKASSPLCGRRLAEWPLLAAKGLNKDPILVSASILDARETEAALGEEYALGFAEGEAAAVLAAKERLMGRVVVVPADMPLIRSETLKILAMSESPMALTDADGRPAGVYAMDAAALIAALEKAPMANLSDILIALPVEADAEETARVLNCADLAYCAKAMRRRINERHMRGGVTMIDPDAAYIDDTVHIGAGCTIYPGVVLEGDTHIGAGTTLAPGCRIKDTKIGENCVLQAVVARESVVGDGVTVGPFVNLRPNTRIADGCKIGDFVEVKNSNVGAGSKLPHLSYIGDGDVGERVNLGCGTVFVNYDGYVKHRTRVGDDSFIGCHTSLVAPVTVGRGAFTAAGSVITEDVPDDSFAVARARQTIKHGWAAARRKKHEH